MYDIPQSFTDFRRSHGLSETKVVAGPDTKLGETAALGCSVSALYGSPRGRPADTHSSKSGCTISPRVSPISDGPMGFRKQKSSRGPIQNWARQRHLDAEPALSMAHPAGDLQTPIAQNLDVGYPQEFHRFQTVPWAFGNKSRSGARYKIGRDSGTWMLSQRSVWLSQRETCRHHSSKSGCTISPRVSPISDGPMGFRKQKSSRGPIQNWARQRHLDAEPALSMAHPAGDLQTPIAQNLDVGYPQEFHRFQRVPWAFGNKSRRVAR